MAEMSKYCKAYLAKDLRRFSGWKEDLSALRPHVKTDDDQEEEIERSELKDDDVLYLQDSYVVTDGVFRDENVVFADASEEWKVFCQETLNFEIPEFARTEAPEKQESEQASS